jgi:SAM-dependent methyltransferase
MGSARSRDRPALGHEEGWRRLWRHSYRVGARWLVGGARRRWPHRRAGLNRLLVPLDPWRYWELGVLAARPYSGRWLDVSSPKLLPSLLASRREGDWVCVDLFSDEIAAWRDLDPLLDLRVEDARALSFPDASFDGCLCVSVIEHVTGEGDADAMAEIWRVLRPGGTLRLTTNVAAGEREVGIDDARYGEASDATTTAGQVFFERHYTRETLRARLLRLQWEVVEERYVRMRDPRVHDRFHRLAPASYLAGGALRFVAADNFVEVESPADLAPGEMGVVLLELRKPAAT